MATEKIIRWKSKLTSIWTNPNPGATFPSQTISVDLSAYDAIMVYVRRDKDGTSLLAPMTITSTFITDEPIAFIIGDIVDATGSIGRRIFSIAKNGIIFNIGTKYTTYGTASIEINDILVPVEIIGITF